MEIDMTPIKKDWLRPRAYNALLNEELDTLEQVAAYGIHPLLRCPNISYKTVNALRAILVQHGLRFSDEGAHMALDSSSNKKKAPPPDGYAGKWNYSVAT